MVYDVNGISASDVYAMSGSGLLSAYDASGREVYSNRPDYTNYSFTQKWASKNITPAQGFDVYDGKVFWIKKDGNTTIPADCYVFNLSDGSYALNSQYITMYSGHGNNLSFDFPTIYATTAYQPSNVYVNTMTNDFVATLAKTLLINDGSVNCDACVDETDKTILWTLGHTAGSSDLSAPYLISKWDLSNLTDNGDGSYTPARISSVESPQPSTSFYFQGVRMHDGLLWYANGNGTGRSYIYAVNPTTGEREYTIDLETNAEPEGLAWVSDNNAVGGFALYVGFAGMMMRKYVFAAKEE